MKKETLKQLEQFEIFVERMESFVDSIQLDGYSPDCYDLRMPNIEGMMDNIYPLPKTIKDYAEIWQDILDIQENITDYYKKIIGDNTFFDVYWNCPEENRAEYTGESMFVYFDKDNKICYEEPDLA